MNTETIYTTLLSQPRSIEGKTWHGLSYQLSRDESGKIEVTEFGWPTKLTLWESDGPELDTLDEATVKGMIEEALPVDDAYVIPPPPVPYVATYSPEAWTSMHFSPMQVSALQRFEMALLQAGKPLGPLMTALKSWMEGMLVASVDPTPRAFSAPPCSYEAASLEAVSALQE
jgi:hypothetical protein